MPIEHKNELIAGTPNWPEPGRCKWPIGDPGKPSFKFCNHPGLPGDSRPYCAHHAYKAADQAGNARARRRTFPEPVAQASDTAA